MPEPRITTGDLYDVDMSTPRVLTMDQLAARQVRDGNHFWVIGLLHHVADPSTPVDDMVCDETNLVGVIAVSCLFCRASYGTERHTTVDPACPG